MFGGWTTCRSFHLMLSWSSCLEAVEDSWMSSGVSSAESSLTIRISWRRGATSSLKAWNQFYVSVTTFPFNLDLLHTHLTHNCVIDVVLQRVDEEVAHRLPGGFGLLRPRQPQVELVHGALQVLKALQSLFHLILPTAYVALQARPALLHFHGLLTDRPGQTSGLLLGSGVYSDSN